MPRRALIVTHVPWEGPHRIARALEGAGLELDFRCTLDGDPLPSHQEVSAAVFMGGPMNVDETDRYPSLALEREWIAEAVRMDMPMLGVCLGSQLLARALGAAVTPGPAPEIGWSHIQVHVDSDPLIGPLAPAAEVLHWHGDVIGLPPGATLLASSEQSPVQAFRRGNAWGLLFHAEADLQLAEQWMAEPSMRAEAEAELGDQVPAVVSRAREIDQRVRTATDPVFEAFAELAIARGA